MRLDGRSVLLVDDTWTRGASAQSAAAALMAAGATRVALVVLGRHIDPDWRVVQGQPPTCGEVIATTPAWSWTTCAVSPLRDTYCAQLLLGQFILVKHGYATYAAAFYTGRKRCPGVGTHH